MDKKILEFINSMQVLSVSMCDEIGVYTASSFYVFDEINLSFLIASYENVKHIKLAYQNPNVAVNIAKEDKISKLKGLQAKALFSEASKEQEQIYYAKFPFANLSRAKIYALKLTWAKFTDNTLMLAKKLEFRLE